MTIHDPAFLWETEAMRGRGSVKASTAAPPRPGWVTLRQAHDATAVPIGTLRKWGRQGSVPSMVVESDIGPRRLVRLESVMERAHRRTSSVADTSLPKRTGDRKPGQVVAAGEAPSESPRQIALSPPPGHDPETPPPDGTMIVPIAAWDKMLMQLGNLHEAGQQLAEARERATKAETEAAFLRERLAEMRADTERRDDFARPSPDEPLRADPVADSARGARDIEVASTESVLEYALRRWRTRRRT